ncbi:MAG TPA: hypothetical protein VLI92_02270 [Candidatus Saccharimonadales bacterium]|nr:hypothetical protein [Candidatus Saccharimonadales bacterium]
MNPLETAVVLFLASGIILMIGIVFAKIIVWQIKMKKQVGEIKWPDRPGYLLEAQWINYKNQALQLSRDFPIVEYDTHSYLGFKIPVTWNTGKHKIQGVTYTGTFIIDGTVLSPVATRQRLARESLDEFFN